MPNVFVASIDGHLDKIIAKQLSVSRRVARRLIATGSVAVNQKNIAILLFPIKKGDSVMIQNVAEPTSKPSNLELDIPILLEDKDLLVVNKPAHLLSEIEHAYSPTVISELQKKMGSKKIRLELVHRLDAGTSGLLILSKKTEMTTALTAMFKQGKIKKSYRALVAGDITHQQLIDMPIDRIRGSLHGVLKTGRPAQTRVIPCASQSAASLLHLEPLTGRTHQLRVHLAAIGHPIVGDGKYGGPKYLEQGQSRIPLERFMLHAEYLVFVQPNTQKNVNLRADLPKDFIQTAIFYGMQTDCNHDKIKNYFNSCA